MNDLAAAERLLHKTFCFDAFRAGQADIVSAILAGEDVLAIMPTGSGKSLCYQLPALLRDGLTLVVSPLIALMRNQVAQLQSYGVAAASLTSSNDFSENRDIAERISRGDLKLIYIAPERLARPDTIAALRRAKVAMLAVDEAHCISQWGHDFRPDYMNLGAVQDALGGVQTIAFTATADVATRGDIVTRLFRREARVFVHGFDRPNIRLVMRTKNSGGRQILDFVAPRRGQSGIVYCASRRKTEELAETLRDQGIHALAYHAGLESTQRSRHQDVFLQEDGIVMTATVAFGMGIDKPDIRFVCHADLPSSIEAYYQEIGRAGRDGLPAETLTLYGMGDIRLRRMQIDEGDASDEQKRIERQRLNALVALCESPRCRRQTLLAYFGESAEPCGNCDLCTEGVVMVDATVAAQKALSAIMRTGERFATEHLVSILIGDDTEAIQRFGHNNLKTFGVGKEHSKNEWRSMFRQLYAAGIIEQDIAGYGRWTVTDLGLSVLKGLTPFELRKEAAARASRATRRAMQAAAVSAEDVDQRLLDALKQQRTSLARAQNVPAYVIFPDRTLIEMARAKPANRDALARIHGVGEAKLARYGDAFLEVIKSHA